MTDTARTKGAWSSSLSTNEYAACLALGLEPLGFVQGVAVMSWSFGGTGLSSGFGGFASMPTSGFRENYQCPHGYVSAEHRMYGLNYEQTWIEETWNAGFSAAYARLIDEARRLGATGVIGLLAHSERHAENSAMEFRITGTAVGLPGSPVPERPFTTFLAGQKLNKLVEAGYAPVGVVVSFISLAVFASCVTEYQLSSGGAQFFGGAQGGEITQLARAHAAARALAREGARRQLEGDVLHGATLAVHDFEAQGGPQIEVMLRGNRVRRFKEFDPLPPPRPVVRLVDR